MIYRWLSSSLDKLENPGWMVTGVALKGFWTRVVAISEAPARPAIAFDWYQTLLQSLLDSGSYTCLLILAWKTTGFWGLDRFVLPMLGTPWQLGKVFKTKTNR